MKAMTTLKHVFVSTLLLISTSVFAATPSDAEITQTVKQEISNNPTLTEFAVDVVTKDGVVELIGTVNLDTDAGTIIEIAQGTDGVKDVEASKLKVKKSDQPIEDTIITAKVKGEFLKAKLFGDDKIKPMSIHVETKNGIVTLTGKAMNQSQINDAITLAKKVKNVKDVKSMVQLSN